MKLIPLRTALLGGLFVLATGLTAAGPSALLSSAFQEDLGPGSVAALKDKDQQKLGDLIGEYMEARRENEDILEAESELWKALDKHGKKLKGRDPLSLTTDLSNALWWSNDYAGKKGFKKGKVETFSAEIPAFGAGYSFEYAVHVPSDYNPKKNKYPLLLIIPDAGADPFTVLTERWEFGDLRSTAIVAVIGMPLEPERWTQVGGRGEPGGGGHVLVAFRDLSNTYGVDFDKIFLCGDGAGVDAAAVIAGLYPDRFAGVIGRAGDTKLATADNYKNLPTLFTGGGEGVTSFEKAIADAGYGNCSRNQEAGQPEILAWMQATTRISYPSGVRLIPGSPIPNKAYWLEVPAHDGVGTAEVEGRIDTAANRIEITGSGVSSVTLYLNDILVDLDKPLLVICNGVEQVRTVARSRRSLLDYIYKAKSDPGRFYVAEARFDLPAGESDEE